MSNKEITPLSDAFLRAFDEKASTFNKKKIVEQTDVQMLEEEISSVNRKLSSARQGGFGDLKKLNEEKSRLQVALDEAKKLSAKDMKNALASDKAKAQSKDKVSLKKAPWDESVDEEVELDEAPQPKWKVQIGNKHYTVTGRNTAEAGKKAKRLADKDGNNGVGGKIERISEEVEALDEMKQPFIVVDTADDNKVVGMASDERGAKMTISSAERPPMSIKDKSTLKIVKSRKKQNIGRPLVEDTEITELHMSLLEAHGIEKKVAERVKKVFDGMSDADKAAFMKSYLKNPKAATEYMFKDMKKMAKEEVELDEGRMLEPAFHRVIKAHKYKSDASGKNYTWPQGDRSTKIKHNGTHVVTYNQHDGSKVHKTPASLNKHLNDLHDHEVDMKSLQESFELDEALDSVDPKAVKKKFDDRKDKDIDNDGDTDSSDEYLHKRRKAISKALAKEEVELDEAGRKTDGGSRSAKMGASRSGESKIIPKRGTKAYAAWMAKNAERRKGDIARWNDEKLDEAKDSYTINHKTFSSAVQHALDVVKKRGFEVDDEEWDRKVAMGPKKPGKGKTNSYTIDLMKAGKETKRKLQMQVYYDEGRYELNMYVS